MEQIAELRAKKAKVESLLQNEQYCELQQRLSKKANLLISQAMSELEPNRAKAKLSVAEGIQAAMREGKTMLDEIEMAIKMSEIDDD